MDILIVEDDQQQARNIERALLLAGHRTELAPDGAIGLDEALARPFDLILLDLLLPLVDGFAVCRQLRQREVRTPILMLTAATPSASVSAGSTRALHDYLTKPFATEELLARVRALGRRSRDALDDALRVDDLVLDPARHEVQRGDRYVELTPKAFERQAVLGARCNGHNAGQLRRHVHLPVRVVAPGDHTAVLCQCQTVQSPCSDSCHAGMEPSWPGDRISTDSATCRSHWVGSRPLPRGGTTISRCRRTVASSPGVATTRLSHRA